MTTKKAAQSPKTNTLTPEQRELAALDLDAYVGEMTYKEVRRRLDLSSGINISAVALHKVEGSECLSEEEARRAVYAGYGEDIGGLQQAIEDERDCLALPNWRENAQLEIIRLSVVLEVARIDAHMQECKVRNNQFVDRILGFDCL